MSTRGKSRRTFLIDSVTGLSGAWVAANYSGILAAEKYVLKAAQSGRPMSSRSSPRNRRSRSKRWPRRSFRPTKRPARAKRASSTSSTGRSTTFAKNNQAAYTKGLDDLQAQTKQMFPTATTFSALTGPQQIQVLTAMEKTPFFNTVRTHTIIGFFASPVHGGNQDKIGWKLIGYDDSLNFRPPFGYYDAQDPAGRR